MIENTISPARHRRQKAMVRERTRTTREHYQRLRDQRAEEERKLAFDRACLQAAICGIKSALGLTVTECEQPVWPDSQWLTPKTFAPEFYERAMRYFDPKISEEYFHRELSCFQYFYQIEHWLKARTTIVERLEFDGPWYDMPIRSGTIFPMYSGVAFYFDMSRIEVILPKAQDELREEDRWRYWKLRPVSKVPEEHAPPSEIYREAFTEVYEKAFSPKVQLAMADKNQGYVPGEMWWNRLWARIKEAFTGE